MARGITRTGNPFHRVPLLFTTRDSEGKLVSFMPGGPRILDSRRQDVVVCMTLDAENNEIPIPFMGGDIGYAEEVSDLGENPPDGLIAIVEKGELRTEGRLLQPFDEVDTAYFAFEIQLEDIRGMSSMDITTCKFGEYTGSLSVVFIQDVELLGLGLSGPAMIITNGGAETMDLLYIRTAQAGLLEGVGETAIEVDAGWNKLVRTTNIWRQTPKALSAVPTITDAVVGEVYREGGMHPFSSTTEWIWASSLAYSLGGEWHGELKPQLPEFIATFPETDNEEEHLLAHTLNMYSMGRYMNGECKEPDIRAYIAIMSGRLNVAGLMDPDIPTATLHTPSAVKAALEIKLSAFIALATGGRIAITLDEFEYYDGIPMEGQTAANNGSWYGRVVWQDLLTQQVVKEPYLHKDVEVTFCK